MNKTPINPAGGGYQQTADQSSISSAVHTEMSEIPLINLGQKYDETSKVDRMDNLFQKKLKKPTKDNLMYGIKPTKKHHDHPNCIQRRNTILNPTGGNKNQDIQAHDVPIATLFMNKPWMQMIVIKP